MTPTPHHLKASSEGTTCPNSNFQDLLENLRGHLSPLMSSMFKPLHYSFSSEPPSLNPPRAPNRARKSAKFRQTASGAGKARSRATCDGFRPENSGVLYVFWVRKYIVIGGICVILEAFPSSPALSPNLRNCLKYIYFAYRVPIAPALLILGDEIANLATLLWLSVDRDDTGASCCHDPRNLY